MPEPKRLDTMPKPQRHELKVEDQKVGGLELLTPEDREQLERFDDVDHAFGEQPTRETSAERQLLAFERYARKAWSYVQKFVAGIKETVKPAEIKANSEQRLLFKYVDQIFSEDTKQAEAAVQALLGQTVAIHQKQYRLDALKGKGGYGAVFSASLKGESGYVIKFSHSFGRDYLNKMLPEDASQELEYSAHRGRVATVEIASLHRLNTDSLDDPFPHYYGATMVADPDRKAFAPDRRIAAIAMEDVSGQSLAHYLDQDETLTKQDPDLTVHWVQQLVRAVQQMHDKDVLHLDIKPGNVLVRAQDQLLKLTDFGGAQLTQFRGKTEKLPRWTRKLRILLSDRYVTEAEQLNCTKARDVYALGVTIKEMLYGKLTDAEPANKDQLISQFPLDVQVIAHLADKMTNADPAMRITLPEVQQTLAQLSKVAEPQVA